jgi:DNA primase
LIPKETINTIIDRSDIVSIVGEYVKLQKKGQNYIGLCPFHNEKTPSFVVSPEKSIYHCFGCGEGGNTIGFVRKLENYSFVDTIKHLGNKCGVEVNIEQGEDTRSPLLKIVSKTRKYYQNNLFDDRGRVALKYFLDRGISEEVVKELGLGFSTKSINGLVNYLRKSKFTDEEIVRAGVAIKKDNGELLDRFRSRAIFPISNVVNEVVAFGGRLIEKNDKMAKYINSPESEIYYKGKMLYGLNTGRDHIRKAKRVLVVEGYMDHIAIYKSGIKNVVATLGTAMTKKQAAILEPYVDEVIMCYDSDEAGKTAALKAATILYGLGLNVKIATFSQKDPDDTIKIDGFESFKKQISKAKSFYKFEIDRIVELYGKKSVESINKIVNDSLDFLISFNDEMLIRQHVKVLAEELDIPEDSIFSKYRKKKSNVIGGDRVRKLEAKFSVSDKYVKAQESIIRIISKSLEHRNEITQSVDDEDFSNVDLRSIYQKIKELDGSPSSIVESIDDDVMRQKYIEINMKDDIQEEVKSLGDNIQVLKNYKREMKISMLMKNIKDAQDRNDQDAQNKLLSEYNEIMVQKV